MSFLYSVRVFYMTKDFKIKILTRSVKNHFIEKIINEG